MSKKQTPIITYKGRSLGIVVLTVAQIIIGAIHAFFGLLLLAFENLSFIQASVAYDVYTFVFGVAGYGFCRFYLAGQEGRVGWYGCRFPVCYCCGFFNVSGFTKHPRDPKVSRVCGDYVQHIDCQLLVHREVREKYLG